MNINQMKSAISKFRKANLSVIKDEKLRAKAQKLQGKEKGFTLLELLIVITLIAILATGALIAYEGVGDNAQAAGAANNAATIDRAIRTYKAVDGVYPNQWDSLVTAAGSAVPFLPAGTSEFVGAWSTGSLDDAEQLAIATALASTGIEELQYIVDGSALVNGKPADVAPNRAHNESTNPNASEFEFDDAIENSDTTDLPTFYSVIPNGICTNGNYPNTKFDTTEVVSNELQNAYADLLEGDECHAVIALGFGGDAAASTALSRVAIANSPTYNREGIVDASTEYSRFVGLFLVGLADEDDESTFNYLPEARLLAIVAPDGRNIDQLNAEASGD